MRLYVKGLLLLTSSILVLTGCTKNDERKEVWIYTSLYKDTLSVMQPKLEKAFPGIHFQFYQAGSEEIAAKIQAEQLAGKIQADIVISSDVFWFEELSKRGQFLAYKPAHQDEVPTDFKHPEGFYTTVSYPVMVLAYNSEVVKDNDAPKSFKSLTDTKWKDKISMGSPLASGTAFTTVATLLKKYDWSFFKDLRKNNIIAEGGNSGVVRRLQSKERPVGIVLLENILRLTKTDPRIKFVVPTDGVILQTNSLAIIKKEGDQSIEKKVADWMFQAEGQKEMISSFMYASTKGYSAPEHAPEWNELTKNASTWSRTFIDDIMKTREAIKDQFSKIIF